MLNPGGQAFAILVIVCLGAAIGIGIQRIQPLHHRDDPTKDIVKLIMGLMATMTALILSLLIASAHGFFDAQRQGLQQMSVNVLLLDHALAEAGPQTAALRQALKHDLQAMDASLKVGRERAAAEAGTLAATGAGALLAIPNALSPATDEERAARGEAQSLVSQIAQERLLIHEQATTPWPPAVAAALLCWLFLLFLFFGLFAPCNLTVIISLFIGAMSVSGAMLLMLSMSNPYRGVVHLSDLPLRRAIAQIGD